MVIDNWFVNPELRPDEIDKRRDAAQSWVSGMSEVVKKTRDVEALSLFNGILSEIAIGRPDAVRHLVPVQGPEQPTIVLVPLFTEDTNISDTTKLVMSPNSSQAAHYTENRPGRIFFNAETPLSPILKGVLMHHEAKHADFFEASRYREGTKLDHWHEEAATFNFEFRLMEKLGGQPYKAFMNKTVPRFIQEYDDKVGKGGTLPKPASVDASVLDKVFGLSQSTQETKLRKSIIWMDIIFRMFEKIYPATAERDKAIFLRQLYTQLQD